MTVWTLIIFDDDNEITHLEHFSSMPNLGSDDLKSLTNLELFEGNMDGGDSILRASRR